MNNKFKRALSSILAFIMLLSMVTVMNVSNVFAATSSYMPSASGVSIAANEVIYEDSSIVLTATAAVTTVAVSDSNYDKAAYPYAIPFRNNSSGNTDILINAKVSGTFTGYVGINSGKTMSIYEGNSTSGTVLKKVSTTTKAVNTISADLTAGQTYYFCAAGTSAQFVKAEYVTADTNPNVSLAEVSAKIKPNETAQITATANNFTGDATITYISNDESVATVDESGLVTGVADGTTTITVTATDGTNTATVDFSIEVTSYVAVTNVTVSPSTASIFTGNTKQLTATVTPDDADVSTVTWSSDNEAVATVDQTGLVTAVSAGTATIKATSDDTKVSLNGSATVTVTAKPDEICNYNLSYGEDESFSNISFSTSFSQLTAPYGDVVYLEDGKTVTAFTQGLFPNGTGGTMTIKMNAGESVDVYYTMSDSNYTKKTATKSGYLKVTTSSDTETVVAQENNGTSSERYGNRAYKYTFTADTADTYIISGSGNRVIFFGVNYEADVNTPNNVITGTDGTVYYLVEVTADQVENSSSYKLVATEDAAIATESSDTVYDGVEIDGTTYTAESLGYDYVVGFVIEATTGATIDTSSLSTKYELYFE